MLWTMLAGVALAQDGGHGEHGGVPPSGEEHAGAERRASFLTRLDHRTASGTAWQPDAAPMHGFSGKAGDVDWMVHANVFGLYDAQASERGDGELGSVNWAMGAVGVTPGAADLGLRAMVSLEPFTVGGDGYPLLGQTGETWEGEPLTDRQHPHDLLMEVAATWRQALGGGFGFELYAAPVGEPALGPVAFPHRASALYDPVAPLSHHWQDSTHISHGVLTAGVATPFAKVEGSWFNGREPDERRLDLDLAAPESWSARVTVNPIPPLSAQVSYGALAGPERLEPEKAVDRWTASATWNAPMEGEGNWATTAAWGRNAEEGEPVTDAALIESALSVGPHVNVFGRAEYVVKTAHDLQVDGAAPDATYGLASLGLGHVYTIEAFRAWKVGLGVRGNVLVVPAALEPTYGSRAPVGGLVYVQALPGEADNAAPRVQRTARR